MTKKERMQAALLRKEMPDKVPHGDVMIWPQITDKLLGGETLTAGQKKRNFLHYWTTQTFSKTFFERDLAARNFLGFDWTHVFPREKWTPVGTADNGMPIERDPFGVDWMVSPESSTMVKSPLEDISKIRTYEPPGIDQFSFDNLAKWVNESDLFTFVQIDTGIFKLYQILGFNNFMMNSIEYAEELQALQEKLVVFQEALARKAIESGADAIWLSDDHAGLDSPFISPAMMYELDFKYQKKIVDAVHEKGRPCIMHSCGNLDRTIEGMLATGVDAIMAIQPTAKNDIYAMKKQYENKITFIGNICISNLMPHGKPADVDAEVRRLISEVGKGGGFVLSTCNALLDDQPIENVITMHLAAEKYGSMHS